MKSRKNNYTLLELLLVLAILSFAAVGVGYFAIRMNGQQKFYSSATRFAETLQAAEEIMVIHSQEIKLKVSETGNELLAAFEFDQELPPAFQRLFAKRQTFEAIDSIALLRPGGEREEKKVTLTFNPVDYSTTEGVLSLGWKGEHRYIRLTGYPAPLKLETEPPKLEKISFSSEALYPEEARQR